MLQCAEKRSSYPGAAGVLILITASLAFLIGVFSLASYVSALAYSRPYSGSVYSYNLVYVGEGVFNIVAFLFGLIGSICAIKRKKFTIALLGATFILAATLVSLLPFVNVAYFLAFNTLLYVAPMFIMSIISLVFIGVSKKEFT